MRLLPFPGTPSAQEDLGNSDLPLFVAKRSAGPGAAVPPEDLAVPAQSKLQASEDGAAELRSWLPRVGGAFGGLAAEHSVQFNSVS